MRITLSLEKTPVGRLNLQTYMGFPPSEIRSSDKAGLSNGYGLLTIRPHSSRSPSFGRLWKVYIVKSNSDSPQDNSNPFSPSVDDFVITVRSACETVEVTLVHESDGSVKVIMETWSPQHGHEQINFLCLEPETVK